MLLNNSLLKNALLAVIAILLSGLSGCGFLKSMSPTSNSNNQAVANPTPIKAVASATPIEPVASPAPSEALASSTPQVSEESVLPQNLVVSGPVYSIAISPGGKVLIGGNDHGTLAFWALKTGRTQIRPPNSVLGKFKSVAFSPDGQSFALANRNYVFVTKFLNQKKDQAPLTRLPKQNLELQHDAYSDIEYIAFSPHGRYLVSAGGHDIKVWDLKTGQTVLTFPESGTTSIAFSPDGKSLASAGSSQFVHIWNLKTGQVVQTLKGHESNINGSLVPVAFSPNGQFLASSSDNDTVQVWDLKTEQVIQTLEGHSDWVNSIAFSPNGRKRPRVLRKLRIAG